MIEMVSDHHCLLLTDAGGPIDGSYVADVPPPQRILLDKKLELRWFSAASADLDQMLFGHVPVGDSRADPPAGKCLRVLLPLRRWAADRIPEWAAGPMPAEAMADRLDCPAPAGPRVLSLEGFLLLSLDCAMVRSSFRPHDCGVEPASAAIRRIALESPAAASLLSLCRWLTIEVQRPGSVLHKRSPVSASLEKAILALLMELLADGSDGPARAAQDMPEAHVRKIEAWIDGHLDRDIGVDDLAAAVGTSARAVQAAFRRLRGCTPMQAVQRRRLERARQLLQSPAPDTSVTSVALDCGFSHLGRFSIAFHGFFGEKPSQMLARARTKQRPLAAIRQYACG